MLIFYLQLSLVLPDMRSRNRRLCLYLFAPQGRSSMTNMKSMMMHGWQYTYFYALGSVWAWLWVPV